MIDGWIIVVLSFLYIGVLGCTFGLYPGSANSQATHPMVQVEEFSLNTKTTQYQLESAAADIVKKHHPWLRVTVIPGQTLLEGIGISEKYRRIMEAYDIEQEYAGLSHSPCYHLLIKH